MNIITIATKLDMSCDFYIRHIRNAVEWKLFSMINKDNKLISSASVYITV